MGKVIAFVLAAFLLAAPPPDAGQPQDSQAAEQQEQSTQKSRSRLYWILGGTVAGVTGMWLSLYRRGK